MQPQPETPRLTNSRGADTHCNGFNRVPEIYNYIWTHQLLRQATGPHVARSHDCTFKQPCEQDKGLG